MSDGVRSTTSAEPAAREPARERAVEIAPAAADISNLTLQQHVRGGGNVADLPGAGGDNQAMQARARSKSLDAARPAIADAAQPLPHLDRIQASFGRHDVSGVRTVTGGPARGANDALGARAFTAGTHIGFRDTPDVWLAAHESAHVVQQRDGTNRPGAGDSDPWERHADRVADEVVAGRSAEPLLDRVIGDGNDRAPAVQLDKDDAHAQNMPEPFSASSGDKPGSVFFGASTAANWVNEWGQLLLAKLGGYLAGTKFDMPSTFATWSEGSAAAFATALWTPMLATSKGSIGAELGRIIAPDALDPLINAGRDAPTTGPLDPIEEHRIEPKGDTDWAEPVVAEVGKIVVKRVIESLQREIPRWIAARNQLQLSSVGPVKTVDKDPDPKQVVKSHPIDAMVLAGLTGHVTVNYEAYRKANPDQATLGDMHLGELKTVSYRWLHDDGAWNWIQVTSTEPVTAEDVANTLYGDSTYAYTMTAAPPYFGITDTANLKDPALSDWMSHCKTAKKDPGRGDDNTIADPDAQMQTPSLTSDYVMVAEANAVKNLKPSGIKPDEDGRKVLLDRMNASLQTFQLITKTASTLPGGGDVTMTSEAFKRLQQRAFKVADTSQSMNWIIDWDKQTIAQGDLLRQALNGVTVAVQQYKAFSGWGPSEKVANRLGFMYLRVASLSEQALAGQEALNAANDQSKLFPALLMEQVLADVRRALHTEEGANWQIDTNDKHDTRTDLEDHKKREANLRLRLARIRDELLQNQADAAKDLQQLQKDLADLQTEVLLVYDLDAIETAWQALYDDLSMVGVISGSNTDDSEMMSGKEGHDTTKNPALLDLWTEWNGIYREYKYGDQKAAVAKLKERRPVLQSLLEQVRPLIKSNETKNKWVTFGIMLGIALVTAGIGTYVEGLATVAWGAESWATFGVTTGIEAFTFTTLSYGFVDKDPSIAGYFLELGKNLLLFGAMKGITNNYISFIGKDAVGTVDTMIVQFVAMNTASLVEADLKKYAATGQHLTLDEALEISKQNALFMVAAGIATAAARPGLEALKLQGEADGALGQLRTAKTELQKLALQVEGAKTADPAKIDALLAKQRDVLALQDEALKTLEKLAADPKKAGKAGLADPATVDQLEAARQEHAEAVHQLDLATTLKNTEGAGPIRYAERGAKWQAVVDFWKSEGATVEPVVVDEQFGSRTVDITTKDGETFRLLERTSGDAKAVGATATELPGASATTPTIPDAAATTDTTPTGGTKSASAYTLSDTPVQTGSKVAAVARDIAPGLEAEGIKLGPTKANAAKGGSKTASTTLTVTDASGATTSVPVTIEVATDVAGAAETGHGVDSGHASFQIKPDGNGGWTVAIRIEERLANEADVASHLRHELREAKDILGELAKDKSFDVDAAQKSSSLEDPAKATAHDRAAALEIRDLVSELGATLKEGEAARQRLAKSKQGGTAKDRAAAQRGANARARLDGLLDSMGLTDPAQRAAKIKTVMELAGVDGASPLGQFLEGYGLRTDAETARTKALDALDPPTKAKVAGALGDYADLVPPEAIFNIADVASREGGGKFVDDIAQLVKARAAGTIDDATLTSAIESKAQEARAAEAETKEAGGKRLYQVNDPDGNLIGADGLSKEQEAAFRKEIDEAKTPDDKMQARYRRYRAKIGNAVEGTLKSGEPWPFDKWLENNPQVKQAVTEGLKYEGEAIAAIGATPNNDPGAYKQFDFYDKPTNQVVTTRPDAFLGDTPVESKYVDADSQEQVVYDTPQTRAEKAMGGEAGHTILLSQKVEPGQPPPKLRPSRPLATDREVYFYDPALKKITYRWNNDAGVWVESAGPTPP